MVSKKYHKLQYKNKSKKKKTLQNNTRNHKKLNQNKKCKKYRGGNDDKNSISPDAGRRSLDEDGLLTKERSSRVNEKNDITEPVAEPEPESSKESASKPNMMCSLPIVSNIAGIFGWCNEP